jgi:hypothetical protein
MSKSEVLRKLIPDLDDEAIDLIFANSHIKVTSLFPDDWVEGLMPTPEMEWAFLEITDPDRDPQEEEIEPIEDWENLGEH